MKDITTIWKEFNEDQDKKERFAKEEFNELTREWAKNITVTNNLSFDLIMMTAADMSYEYKKVVLYEKHGIVTRTLENALTWNNK